MITSLYVLIPKVKEFRKSVNRGKSREGVLYFNSWGIVSHAVCERLSPRDFYRLEPFLSPNQQHQSSKGQYLHLSPE